MTVGIRPVRSMLAAVLVSAQVAACGGPDANPSAAAKGSTATRPTPPTELMIFAASSLSGAVEEAATAFEAVNPGTTIAVAVDASSALATQIEQGAPADVFLSADVTNPHRLVEAGLARSAVQFASNELTIILPLDNPAAVRSPMDLGRDGLRIVAAGDEVPISTYAAQLVANLAGMDGYPADFAAAYAANVVSREDNVKAVVTKIALGEGDAAIVYVTDSRASAKVAVIDVPAEANVRAAYAGLVLTASPRRELAERFLAWLVAPDGQAILAGAGFVPGS